MNRNLFGLAMLVFVTACATETAGITWVKNAFTRRTLLRNGVSQSGIDYGNWEGSEDFVTASEHHPFVTSIKQYRSVNGDMSLVSALRSDGFNCDTLLPSYRKPVIWHCSNKVMEDLPMSHRSVWNWSVTFLG